MAQKRKTGNSDKSPTAVEFLVEHLRMQNSPYTKEQIIEQAKQMEKEQIMKAVDRGFDEGCKFPEDITLKDAEQYYNETFGNK